MKSKKIVGICAAAAMTVSSMLPLAVTATSADDSVTLSPDYAASIKIVDKDGNALNGAKATVKDSLGNEVASWTVGDGNAWLKNEYVYTSEKYPQVIDFTKLTNETLRGDPPASEVVAKIENLNHHFNVKNAGTAEDPRYTALLSAGTNYTADVKYTPVPDTVDLTLPANQYALIVAPEYANKSDFGVYMDIEDPAGRVCLNYTDDAGKTIFGDGLSVGKIKYMNIIHGSGVGYTEHYVNVRDTASTYKKVKMNVKNLRLGFNDDYTFTSDSGLTTNFHDDDKGICGVLVIVSGGVISAVVPDSEGNVEFYLDRETEKFFTVVQNWSSEVAKTRGHTSTVKYDPTVSASFYTVQAPEDAMNLIFSCDQRVDKHFSSTEFTLSVTAVPEGYEIPEDVKFTVDDTFGYKPVGVTVDGKAESSSSEESSDIDSSESKLESSSVVDSVSQAEESSTVEESSVAESSSAPKTETSSAADSSSKTVSPKADANPNTGKLAGGAAAIVLVLGAAAVATKKKDR